VKQLISLYRLTSVNANDLKITTSTYSNLITILLKAIIYQFYRTVDQLLN